MQPYHAVGTCSWMPVWVHSIQEHAPDVVKSIGVPSSIVVKCLQSLGQISGGGKRDSKDFHVAAELPYTASLSSMYELLRYAYICDVRQGFVYWPCN